MQLNEVPGYDEPGHHDMTEEEKRFSLRSEDDLPSFWRPTDDWGASMPPPKPSVPLVLDLDPLPPPKPEAAIDAAAARLGPADRPSPLTDEAEAAIDAAASRPADAPVPKSREFARWWWAMGLAAAILGFGTWTLLGGLGPPAATTTPMAPAGSTAAASPASSTAATAAGAVMPSVAPTPVPPAWLATATTSFGGRNSELCLAAKTFPVLADASFVVSVTPAAGIVGAARVEGRTDDAGQVKLSWGLEQGTSGNWLVAVDVFAPDGDSAHAEAFSATTSVGGDIWPQKPACEH